MMYLKSCAICGWRLSGDPFIRKEYIYDICDDLPVSQYLQLQGVYSYELF